MTASSAYLSLTVQLRRGRKDRDINQDGAALRIGVSRRTFQRWEDGEALPDAVQLFRWADLVGVEIASRLTHQPSKRAAA